VGHTSQYTPIGDGGSGVTLNANGQIFSGCDFTNLYLNAEDSNNEHIRFRKDGADVGSIGSDGSDLYIESSVSNHAGLRFAGGSILPRYNGSLADNAVDLGQISTNYRFKDLYLSGGVYLGGTGSANKLDDYEEGFYIGTITPSSSGSVTMQGAADSIGYTKVGRMVTVQGDFRISTVSSPVGNSRISLPFAVADLQDLAGRGGSLLLVFTGSVWEQHFAFTSENVSYLEVQITPAASYEYRFFFTYFTN
jgi:hypothetical protein